MSAFPKSPALPASAHAAWICALALLSGCGRKNPAADGGKPSGPAAAETPAPIVSDPALSSARLALADVALSEHRPDQALLVAISAWEADPRSETASAKVRKILAETRWQFPALEFPFPFPIEHIVPAGENHLLIALGAEAGTVVRWNLTASRIESVLFPVPAGEIRMLAVDPTQRVFIIERAGVLLLCDATTLKPLADLGSLPGGHLPSSSVVFSDDGVLLAHAATSGNSTVWHIRSARDGGIVRTIEDIHPPALAGFLDRGGLTLLLSDGSRMHVPVSPVEPPETQPFDPAPALAAASFSRNGNSALVQQAADPLAEPEHSIIDFTAISDPSLEPESLLARFPYSRFPNIWNTLMRSPEQALFRVSGRDVRFLTGNRAPLLSKSRIMAAAFQGARIFTGSSEGIFTTHNTIAFPTNPKPGKPTPATAADFAALAKLGAQLTGERYDPRTHLFRPAEREILGPTEIAATLPELDFSSLHSPFARKLPAPGWETLMPLLDRLTFADPSRKSWPAILERTKSLTLTPWHRQLSELLNRPAADPSAKIAAVFGTGDPAEITALIGNLPESGPEIAKALELALATENAEWIQTILARAKNLPPVIAQIAASRIALLENRVADALEAWPESPPDLAAARLREDWAGWEQADFSPALAKLRERFLAERASIAMPPAASAEQKTALIAKLTNPETLRTVGKPHFSAACLAASEILAKEKPFAEDSLKLSALALQFGEDSTKTLRSQATALTTLQRFDEARDTWVTLITEHPQTAQISNDFAEAAYAAYESREYKQAMEILTTGTHRFPNDANFAMRAGWISLLTGEPGPAYRFLVIGRQIGYPQDLSENATALLVIAAAQSGAPDDANAFRKELLRSNPRWGDSETLDALAWPDELKAYLRSNDRLATGGVGGVLPEKPGE